MNKRFWLLCKLACTLLAAWAPLTASAQSLWKAGKTRSLVSDRRAASVGDILSIVVQENNTTSKDRNTKTTRNSAVDASIDTFLYSPGASSFLTKNGMLPAMKFQSAQDFNGGGSINNSEKIVARIAVRVVDVLPNDNLVIEGRRQTSFGGETQEIILRGMVRPDDISPNNTIFSYNVSDATIQFTSKGTLTNAEKKGWFTRIWEKVSPF
jgi:flagellar L-ring protein precursor FlgH